jgi:2-polyprenyl-3-methyl-5-hydroxy-6-metoxy-1,4-benzoquinol methylase
MAKERLNRERLDPLRLHAGHGLLREHLARYRMAAEILRGRVLDAGCGTGYGAALLTAAHGIEPVVGLDRDARAVAHARRIYGGSGIEFREADLLAGPAPEEGRFDGIACFEVLEHTRDPERLIRTLDALLAPHGVLLISTPLGRGRDFPSTQPGHLFQLRREELTAMLAARFHVRLYGQKGEGIEWWRPGGRYFLMLAHCRPRHAGAAGAPRRMA